MKKFFERKFLIMLLGVVLNVMQESFGIPADTIAWLNTLIVGWILGESAIDSVKTYKNPPVGPNPDDLAAGYIDPALPKKAFVGTEEKRP